MESINIFYGIVEEVFNIISQILLMYLVKTCEIKIHVKTIALIILTLILSFLLGAVVNNIVLTSIFNVFIQFLFFMKIVNVSIKERCIYFIYTSILEAFFVGIVESISNNFIYVEDFYGLNSMYITVFLFTIIAIAFLYKKNKYDDSKEEVSIYIYLFLSMGFLSGIFIILLVDIFGNKLSTNINIGLVIVGLLTIAANIILYVFYTKKYRENLCNQIELVSMEHVLGMQEKYFDDTVESYRELRCFRHDINGYFNTIDGLISDGKYEELQSLIKNFKIAVVQNAGLSCNNIYISATLNQFLHTMDEEDIDFKFDYDVLKEIMVSNNHLCSLIYNLMSNSVEGSIKNTSKRYINLSIHEKNRALIIKTINTVDEDFSLADLKVGVSRKENKIDHGIGLRNIKMVVEKYNGSMDFELKNGKLETCVILLQVIEDK